MQKGPEGPFHPSIARAIPLELRLAQFPVVAYK